MGGDQGCGRGVEEEEEVRGFSFVGFSMAFVGLLDEMFEDSANGLMKGTFVVSCFSFLFNSLNFSS